MSSICIEGELALHQMYSTMSFCGQKYITDRGIVQTVRDIAMRFVRYRKDARAIIMIIAKIRLITRQVGMLEILSPVLGSDV